MPSECKEVTCCDLDDFPQNSSSEGNCPVGWQWDGTSCVRCDIPAAPSLALSPNIILIRWYSPVGRPFVVSRKAGFDGWESPFVPARLTGTVSRMNLDNTLSGTGTLFLSELTIGDTISVPNDFGPEEELRVVTGITSDILLTVDVDWIASWSGTDVYRMPSGFTDLGSGDKEIEDTDVVPDVLYSYRVAVNLEEQCGSMEGETASAVAI